MKREQTIENLYQLAQLTQQVQADRIEIVLEERRDEHFPPMSKALMETRSGLTRRKLDEAIAKMEEAGHQFTKNNANHYSISLSEAHMLMDAAGVPKFHERKKIMRINLDHQRAEPKGWYGEINDRGTPCRLFSAQFG